MYHTCDNVRSISYIRGITINHLIIYKQKLNQLHCHETEYGSQKPPNLFLKNVFFNNIPNISGGLSSKILLSWISATSFSIKTLHRILLDLILSLHMPRSPHFP